MLDVLSAIAIKTPGCLGLLVGPPTLQLKLANAKTPIAVPTREVAWFVHLVQPSGQVTIYLPDSTFSCLCCAEKARQETDIPDDATGGAAKKWMPNVPRHACFDHRFRRE